MNNGLHGWHLDDIEQYPVLYETLVQFLLTEFKDTPIALILTTSVANEDREKRVKLRNQAVVQIAEKYDLPVIDLYSVSVEYSAYRREDGVHFAPEGYQKFAERIVDDLNRILNK